MSQFTKKRKGTALPEYIIIAVLFALTLGISLFQVCPVSLRTYFEKSMDRSATTDGSGNLTIKVMGE